MYDKTPYSAPDGLNNVEFTTLTSRQFAAIEETHSFTPGFGKLNPYRWQPRSGGQQSELKAINPDSARVDLRRRRYCIRGPGCSPGSNRKCQRLYGGIGGSPTYFYHWNSAQIYDDAFFTKGKHSSNLVAQWNALML